MNDVAVGIRRARIDDAEYMARLTHLIAETEGHPEDCYVNADDMRKIVISEGWARTLIACDPNDSSRIWGMLLYYPSFPSFEGKRGYFVENLAVDPEISGAGVATALFKALQERAHEDGVGAIEWVCDRENTRARRFYEQRVHAVPSENYMLYSFNTNTQIDAPADPLAQPSVDPMAQS